MKTIVIHHSADYDGIFCREIARKFLPEATLVGWNFGDPPVSLPPDTEKLLIMDLPCDKPLGVPLDVVGQLKGLVWIDHHKSSIESHPKHIWGYRLDGVAACRLAWQWFNYEWSPINPFVHPANQSLPVLSDYVERRVVEPWAVRLAGEYDIWDKRDPDAEVFQHGLCSRELDDNWWQVLLYASPDRDMFDYGNKCVQELLEAGNSIQYAQQQADASVVKYRSFMVDFEGLKFLALNTARCNSLTFAAKDVPETGHDALLGYYFNGKEWKISLYHARHRTDLDLSQIAVQHGGGGHRGACGFACAKLPF